MAIDLPLVAAGVIAFGIIMYVLLDGFDLGVGILFPAARSEADRDWMIATIAPVWDGNETWLILGGAVLFAAFPTAYAVALPALYLPIMLLLFALIFRGVAFEFRAKAVTSKHIWTKAFCGGSLVAAFAQGLLLGGLIEGVTVADRQFAGGAFDWLTPFSVLTGVAVICGYGLLGATWLVAKTGDGLQADARRWSRILLVLVAGFMAVVSIATPLMHESIAERWFADWHLLYLSPVPLTAAAVSLALWIGLGRDWVRPVFFLAAALFLLGYLGLVISLWPAIVPPTLTIHSAAAPASSLIFVLTAVAITLPMVLGYTAYAYWVFRGKSSPDGAYHG